MPKMVRTRVASPSESPAGTDWGFPMGTGFLIVIMSLVALHAAALLGGGVALGVMRLLGYRPVTEPEADGRESIH